MAQVDDIQEEGRVPETASDTALPWWENLSRDEQQAVLEGDVDWEGFDEAQKKGVIDVVLEGESGSFFEVWMDGIKQLSYLEPAADIMPPVPLSDDERFDRLVDAHRQELMDWYYSDVERKNAQHGLVDDFRSRIEALKHNGVRLSAAGRQVAVGRGHGGTQDRKHRLGVDERPARR